MVFSNRTFGRAVVAVAAVLATAGGAAAQGVIVAEYAPPPVTSYSVQRVVEYAPAVSYPAPRVAYYPAPVVAAPVAPVAAYYPGPVTAVRYGVFGRPRAAATYYPGYVLP